MRAFVVAVLSVFALTACGDASPAAPGPTSHLSTSRGTPEASLSRGHQTITVASTVHPGRDGMLYVEGAIPEIRLRDGAGKIIATKLVRSDGSIRFTDLAPGAYQLEPALRPCDGNCGYLDPRTDSCRSSVELVDSLTVTVRFTVGDPCRIST